MLEHQAPAGSTLLYIRDKPNQKNPYDAPYERDH
jgi:hypothetical protein